MYLQEYNRVKDIIRSYNDAPFFARVPYQRTLELVIFCAFLFAFLAFFVSSLIVNSEEYFLRAVLCGIFGIGYAIVHNYRFPRWITKNLTILLFRRKIWNKAKVKMREKVRCLEEEEEVIADMQNHWSEEWRKVAAEANKILNDQRIW